MSKKGSNIKKTHSHKKVVALLQLILEEEQLVTQIIQTLHEEGERDQPRLWARDWVLRRPQLGPKIYHDFALEDDEKFFNAFRMTEGVFEELLSKIKPDIQKQDTVMRSAIAPEVRLKVTLRYLATGANFPVLEDLFCIPKGTLSRLIPEVCHAIWSRLRQEYNSVPNTAMQWKSIMDGFEEQWQYPGCIGAIDGKHIVIQKPPCSGSVYYNYKGTFSLVLLGIVDSKYRFLYYNIGTPGSTNDAAIWNDSTFKLKMDDEQLSIPSSITLANGAAVRPHLVGDDIFGLTTSLMKPFPIRATSKQLCKPEVMYNYRLSRARRVVENAFGILTKRWQVLANKILLSPSNAMTVVQATIGLHNFLISTSDREGQGLSLDTNSGNQLLEMRQLSGNSSSAQARHQRNTLKDFFSSPEGSKNAVFSWKHCFNEPCPYKFDD